MIILRYLKKGIANKVIKNNNKLVKLWTGRYPA